MGAREKRTNELAPAHALDTTATSAQISQSQPPGRWPVNHPHTALSASDLTSVISVAYTYITAPRSLATTYSPTIPVHRGNVRDGIINVRDTTSSKEVK